MQVLEQPDRCWACDRPWPRTPPRRLFNTTRVLVVEDKWGAQRWLYITDAWTPASGKAYALEVGLKPLYIVTMKDKRNA